MIVNFSKGKMNLPPRGKGARKREPKSVALHRTCERCKIILIKRNLKEPVRCPGCGWIWP